MKDGSLKIEYLTWRRISHGLFDYDNALNWEQSTLKLSLNSQVIVREADHLKAFDNFKLAWDHKKSMVKANSNGSAFHVSFFALVYKEKSDMKVYSFHQLNSILDYFGEAAFIKNVDLNLQSVFANLDTIKQAKRWLDYLGWENFSKDLWKVAKTLEWRKSSKYAKTTVKGVELSEGDIVKMGRLKV